jgi:AcrR family transcriptional regulator
MRTSRRTIRLAGEDLRNHRHVVALVEGPAEADELLVPFIVDGLEQGDRVVQILDPEVRDAHIERLKASGIDVPAALASHQLEVRTWSDAYMRGGRFDRSAQLAYLRETFAEGHSMGYPLTRLIGSTEWAAESETARDLLYYEVRVDAILRKLPDVAICTYDLNHHTARTIAEVLGIHPVAVVGGTVRTSPGPPPASARDRLLAAASQLFQEGGIQATGVDSLIAAASIAKATFYRHFPSKDALVVAWLEDQRTDWFTDVRRIAEDRASSPTEVVPLLFEAAAEWFEADGFRGCPYLNAAVEITDQSQPALRVVRRYLDSVAEQLGEIAAALGLPYPESSGRQLQVLMGGAIGQALAFHSVAPFATAQEAATRVVGLNQVS